MTDVSNRKLLVLSLRAFLIVALAYGGLYVFIKPSVSVSADDKNFAAAPSPVSGFGEKDLKIAKTAVFAAGCFWGVEEAFRKTPGVVATMVGYTGGRTVRPTYHQVCAGHTGHAEAVKIYYNPDNISYAALVDKFFSIHDPTTLNRQGPDIGDQYRSAIFYGSPEEKKVAQSAITLLNRSGKLKYRVVTQVVPAVEFYPAENYHQCWHEKKGSSGCKLQ